MAQIDEEFQKLLRFFQTPEAQKITVEQAVGVIMDFFEKLKTSIENASPEEKAEMLHKMSGMYKQLIEATKQITNRMNLSEKELAAYAENPSNFTAEQWKAMQEAKKMLTKFSEALAQTPLSEQQKGPEAAPPKKEGKPRKRADRSKWTRS
jgi:hypothetical protein